MFTTVFTMIFLYLVVQLAGVALLAHCLSALSKQKIPKKKRKTKRKK